MAIARPVRLWRAMPKKGQTLLLPASVPHVGWLQVIDGQLELSTQQGTRTLLHRGDGVGFSNTDTIHSITSQGEGCDVLLFGLT